MRLPGPLPVCYSRVEMEISMSPENSIRVSVPVEEWGVLWAAFTIMNKTANHELASRGLTVPQASVVGLLGSFRRPLKVTEIGQMLLQESQSASALVDRMCAAGLLERRRDPANRHTVLVSLTEEGARIYEKLQSTVPAFTDEMFSALSPEDRATLRRLLLKFVQHNIQRLR
jgi:DNA-binding MarR family transcriptional regulator